MDSEESAILLNKSNNSILTPTCFILGYFSCGALSWFRVMVSPYGATRSHTLDTAHL